MPAPFATSLCGYRQGNPNTSDASEKFSIELGIAFFDAMGVPRSAPAPKSVGTAMRDALIADLTSRLLHSANHLQVRPERKLAEFEQYAHLGAVQQLTKDPAGGRVEQAITALEDFARMGPASDASPLSRLIRQLREEHSDSIAQRRLLLDILGEESVLGLDVAVSRRSPYASSDLPHLVAGLSLKWSLRTDRAQDCRSQGAKMATLRRGRMPHFAAVTMEPRPYFLDILGRGSGDLDCVYHLHLPALTIAVDQVCSATRARRQSRDKFRRLCDQGRLRDYDDLVAYVATL